MKKNKKNRSSVKFRLFKKGDVNSIKILMYALNKEDTQEMPINLRKIKQLFLHAPDRKFVELYVAERDGKIIGYAIYNKAFSVEFDGMYGEIDEIYIKPEYRNQGIGSKFIKCIEEISKKNKFHALFLVSTTGNTKAHRLYKKLKFKTLPQIGFVKMF
ncbi:MAG: hypothetical protein A2958_01925 [Candidatus Levybacteria bacterium RIFCSPLOWO2_01_FULL_38_13]|nr:MAG: hypothetical protein A2629_02680 [Candidatus Levybacteria bacterium RIFCSPHIGHO2_01_FULL_41_15]OGH35714.1 MAG: hypothetical protein A2958_01925 [Candidatus Levybacteria bacterium RIFCSPLOWO2_01_FULL_38_13]